MNKVKKFILASSFGLFLVGQTLILDDALTGIEESSKENTVETFKNADFKDKEDNLSAKNELENYKNILKYTFDIKEENYDVDVLKSISESESNRDILLSVYVLDIHNELIRGLKTNYFDDVKEIKDYNEIYDYLLNHEGNLTYFNYYLERINSY